jgi:heat shock protein HslJ
MTRTPRTRLTRRVLVGAAAVLTAAGLAGLPAASAAPALPAVPDVAASSLSSLPSLPQLPDAPFAGRWVDLVPGGGGELTFDNGRVTGTDGCNGIGSTYTVTGNVAHVDPFISTMMACPGQHQWLGGVSSIDHYGVLLVVHGSDGQVIGALRPA